MGIDTINYKCPNCSAPMVFGIASQKWECHFCFSTFTRSEIEKIEADTGESLKEPSWSAESFSPVETVVYLCPSCGGRVLTGPNTAATFCVYCHNPTVIADRLTGEYRPARILPFQKPKEDAIKSVQELCRGKFFLPKKFREVVENGEIEGLYVPYWLFSEEYDAQFVATGRNITSWSDSNYHYTKTDTYRVERNANIPIDKIPVDASQRMDNALMEAIEPYDYGKMQSFTMEYLSGHFAETFDVDAEISSKRFYARVGEGIAKYMRSLVTSYQSVAVDSLQTRGKSRDVLYVLLPVWVVSVKFGDKTYTFAMNGQSGKSAGILPVSKGRVLAWIAGLFGALSLLTVVIGGFFA